MSLILIRCHRWKSLLKDSAKTESFKWFSLCQENSQYAKKNRVIRITVQEVKIWAHNVFALVIVETSTDVHIRISITDSIRETIIWEKAKQQRKELLLEERNTCSPINISWWFSQQLYGVCSITGRFLWIYITIGVASTIFLGRHNVPESIKEQWSDSLCIYRNTKMFQLVGDTCSSSRSVATSILLRYT